VSYDWRQHLPTGTRRTPRQILAQSTRHTLTPAQVRLVACPRCGAKPNLHCWRSLLTSRSHHRRNHIERCVAAEALFHKLLDAPI
jgi:hypothetical protein